MRSLGWWRRLAGPDRTRRADRQLGCLLAFVAGAVNAGGFVAVHQYTSHMTGIVSAMADALALGTVELLLAGALALLSFVVGAAVTALLVNVARRRGLHSAYALPLILEAIVLLVFGALGARLAQGDGTLLKVAVTLLCFVMGLQNALITKLSRTEIRTTHITGIVTDIGIELGKLSYRNTRAATDLPRVVADRRRLAFLSLLAASFFVGGVSGALGFRHIGYLATWPLALALVAVAVVPVVDDLVATSRRRRSP